MNKKVDKAHKATHNATKLRGGRVQVDVLLRDGEKYSGQYVAMKSFADHEVITSGTKPEKVFREAKKQGFENPVMLFIPIKGTVNIF